jgi:ribosomal-protein-alanine N-acetyltransferase
VRPSWQNGSTGRHPGWPATLGPLVVPAGTLRLRPPRLRDGAQWSRTRLRDRDYFENWEPASVGTWEDRHALLAWPPQWYALRSLARHGHTMPFMITIDGEVAGQITIGNVVRGGLCSAWVGYWVASHLAGKGVATAALALAVDHCFAAGGLHRVEATVRPENVASIRVLTKTGFRQEGLFRRYLDVAGEWRDHFCYAMTAEETEHIAFGLEGRLLAKGWARPVE